MEQGAQVRVAAGIDGETRLTDADWSKPAASFEEAGFNVYTARDGAQRYWKDVGEYQLVVQGVRLVGRKLPNLFDDAMCWLYWRKDPRGAVVLRQKVMPARFLLSQRKLERMWS